MMRSRTSLRFWMTQFFPPKLGRGLGSPGGRPPGWEWEVEGAYSVLRLRQRVPILVKLFLGIFIEISYLFRLYFFVLCLPAVKSWRNRPLYNFLWWSWSLLYDNIFFWGLCIASSLLFLFPGTFWRAGVFWQGCGKRGNGLRDRRRTQWRVLRGGWRYIDRFRFFGQRKWLIERFFRNTHVGPVKMSGKFWRKPQRSHEISENILGRFETYQIVCNFLLRLRRNCFHT